MLCQNMGFSNDAVQFISYVTKALLKQSMDFHDVVGEEQMFSMGHSCIHGQYQGKTILLDYEELCPTKNELVSGIRYISWHVRTVNNGVARTLKSDSHKRETTVYNIDTLQLCPFSH